MHLHPISVECYAGHKANESPRGFRLDDRRIAIAEILDRWYQGDRDPEWPIADYFKVVDREGTIYILKRDRESDDWFLVIR